MKKIVTLLFAFVLVFSLVACGGDSSKNAQDAAKEDKGTEGSSSKETDQDSEKDSKKEASDNKKEEGKDTEKGEDQMSKHPIVTISTKIGDKELADMKLELYPEKAPNTVANFVSLANSGYYDGLIFHRIIPNFMIQGGDPDGTGMGGPGYGIKGEFSHNGFEENDLQHKRGVISMARSQMPNSAGSQFFICHKDSLFLDGEYAAFGKLIEGEESLDELATTETMPGDRPKTDCVMTKVSVELNGYEVPEVEKQ